MWNFSRGGISEKSANSILIKVNQIETLTTIKLAKANGFEVILSHRSGETEDCSISDLACSVEATPNKSRFYVKIDRLAKYNRLFVIEHMSGTQSIFAGSKVFNK